MGILLFSFMEALVAEWIQSSAAYSIPHTIGLFFSIKEGQERANQALNWKKTPLGILSTIWN